MRYKYWKRFFDMIIAFALIILLLPFILMMAILAGIDTRSNGFFVQERVGQFGALFKIYKLRSLHKETGNITGFGRRLRNSKIDELPQLWNVLIGDMSIVGPRPDIPGYYDLLQGENRNILQLKPGLTCEASIKYRNEEELLQKQEDAAIYNDTVIFPDKVKMNLEYYYKKSLYLDIMIVIKTIWS